MSQTEIKVTFTSEEDPDFEQTVSAQPGDSVLDAALDNGIKLNHNCGAVCACSTCQVYIEEGMEDLPEISDKEEDFIDRAINPQINSRLGCQCILSKGMTVKVKIPDQSSIIGH
jgi:2Fe-2S ferredoxin